MNTEDKQIIETKLYTHENATRGKKDHTIAIKDIRDPVTTRHVNHGIVNCKNLGFCARGA